ncbi:MAG: hypothetical protein HY722_05100 [Planctomycetes bacterium]|nr:hypothetical protein [Planctomycetota bacterium]
MDRARGQGVTEYLIIVVLVGIALITAVGIFGTRVDRTYKDSTEAVAGRVQVHTNP